MLRSSPPGFTRNRTRHDDVNTARDSAKWFRQPVLWLGAAIFLMVLLVCVVTIVLASRHADVPIITKSNTR
jgi:hypothetical protein